MPSSDYTWPRGWLLRLYQRTVDEGCLRLRLRGSTPEENEQEYKSFKAAFLRCRRKRDASFALEIRPEYTLVSLRFEPASGCALLIYDALPDGELLPAIESVEEKERLDLGQRPDVGQLQPTPEEAADDFNPTQFVSGMIEGMEIEDEGEDDGSSTTEL